MTTIMCNECDGLGEWDEVVPVGGSPSHAFEFARVSCRVCLGLGFLESDGARDLVDAQASLNTPSETTARRPLARLQGRSLSRKTSVPVTGRRPVTEGSSTHDKAARQPVPRPGRTATSRPATTHKEPRHASPVVKNVTPPSPAKLSNDPWTKAGLGDSPPAFSGVAPHRLHGPANGSNRVSGSKPLTLGTLRRAPNTLPQRRRGSPRLLSTSTLRITAKPRNRDE